MHSLKVKYVRKMGNKVIRIEENSGVARKDKSIEKSRIDNAGRKPGA
jgi:hypothetical protein